MSDPKREIPKEIKDLLSDVRSEYKYGWICRAVEMCEQLTIRLSTEAEAERRGERVKV